MNLLPYDNVTFSTQMTESMIIKRLTNATDEKELPNFELFRNRPDKPFEGLIKGNTFEIQRIIRGSNPFLPIISGVIVPNSSGCSVIVKMRASLITYFFGTLWCVGVLLFSAAFLISDIRHGKLGLVSFSPLLMIAVFYIFFVGLFIIERKWARRTLQE